MKYLASDNKHNIINGGFVAGIFAAIISKWHNRRLGEKFYYLYQFAKDLEVKNADEFGQQHAIENNFQVVKLLETDEIVGFRFTNRDLIYHFVLFENRLHHFKETDFCFKEYRIYKIKDKSKILPLVLKQRLYNIAKKRDKTSEIIENVELEIYQNK